MEVLRFALLGLGAGGAYALAAQGIVLVYKGSGTINFAHGALAMIAGFVAYEELPGVVPVGVAMAVGVLAGGFAGLVQYLVVLRPLRRSSALARLIATLGVLLLLQALATLRYGGRTRIIRTPFPKETVDILGVMISLDRVILFSTSVVVTAALWMIFRYTLFGRATSAAAENETAIAALGWSPDRLAMVNWIAGGCLAGLAGVLIVPIGGLQISNLTVLVIVAIAAAVVGRFHSFVLAFLGGVGIGVAESEIGRFGTSIPGAGRAVPLLVIVVVLLVSGRGLPLRGYVSDRLPSIGRGTAHPAIVLGAPAALLVVLWTGLPVTWIDAVTSSLIMAVLLLSIVLITGYAGQVSLAQYSLAGVGAFVAGRLVAETSMPLIPAALLAVISASIMGGLFALPAVRTRGVSLAMVTLGLGVALHSLVFTNYDLTGGFDGTFVGEAQLLGIDIDSVRHPERYATVALLAVCVTATIVSRIRRSALGHRMLAIRGDERASAALGIDVVRTKIIVFAISAGIAAISGILTGFRSRSIVYGGFDVFGSIFALAFAVIGGIGYIAGALGGGLFASGGVGARSMEALGGFGRYIEVVAAATLVATLLSKPDGLASVRRAVVGRAPLPDTSSSDPPPVAPTSSPTIARSEHRTVLAVSGLSVSYGGVHAVRDVRLDVGAGEIVGLIGPNGAGKTSLIDGICGFTPIAHGTVHLDGTELTPMSPYERARVGLGRSFQGVGLFDDLTVRENVRAATWATGARTALHTFLRPHVDSAHQEGAMAWRCLSRFGLRDLDRSAESFPLAQRRICGIARALATSPKVLLLDEPAAGLDEVEIAELRRLLVHLAADWNVGILLIEHHVGFVMSMCNRIYVLESGAVLASGPPGEIAGDPRVTEAYLGAESSLETLA